MAPPKKQPKATAPAKKQTTLKALDRNNVDALGLIPITIFSGVRSYILAQTLKDAKEAASRITAIQAKAASKTRTMARLEARAAKRLHEIEESKNEGKEELAHLLRPLQEMLIPKLTNENDELVHKLSLAEESNKKLVETAKRSDAHDELAQKLKTAQDSNNKLIDTKDKLIETRDKLTQKLKTAQESNKKLIETRDGFAQELSLAEELNKKHIEARDEFNSRNNELETTKSWLLRLFREKHDLDEQLKIVKKQLRCVRYQSEYTAGQGHLALRAALQPALQEMLNEAQMKWEYEGDLRHAITTFENAFNTTSTTLKAYKQKMENEVRAAEELVKTNEKELLKKHATEMEAYK